VASMLAHLERDSSLCRCRCDIASGVQTTGSGKEIGDRRIRRVIETQRSEEWLVEFNQPSEVVG